MISTVAPPPQVESATLNILLASFRARVVGPAGILAELRALFPQQSWLQRDVEDGVPATSFEVLEGTAAGGRYQVRKDGSSRWVDLQREELASLLEWAIVEAAVERLGATRLLFHAGAVAHRGRGLLLPAVSGSGKTTLAAALMAEGFRLCSDEIGMLDPATGRLLPFPKSLCVKEGAHATLGARYPGLFAGAPCHQRGAELAWYVHPPIGAWIAAPVPVRFVVFPRYLPGSRTSIAPLPRQAALPLLLGHSFSARQLGRAGVGSAVALLGGAICYSLTVGDLATAVALLRNLYD